MPFEQFEHKLRRKFDAARLDPSEGLWDRISQEIETVPTTRRRPLWLWYGGTAMAVAAAIALLFWLGPTGEKGSSAEPDAAIAQTENVRSVSPVDSGSTPRATLAQAPDSAEPAATRPSAASRQNFVANVPAPNDAKPTSTAAGAASLAPGLQVEDAHSQDIPMTNSSLQYHRPAPSFLPPYQPSYALVELKQQTTQVSHSIASVEVEQIQPDHSSIIPPIKTPKIPRKSVRVNLSATVTSRTSNRAGSLVAYENALAENQTAYARIELPNTTQRIAATAELPLGKGFSVETGAAYSQSSNFSGITAAREDLAVETELLPGRLVEPLAAAPVNQLTTDQLDIPLLVNAYLGGGKGRIRISAGAIAQFLLGVRPGEIRTLVETETFSNGNPEPAYARDAFNPNLETRRSALNAIGKIQYQYAIGSNLVLFGGPVATLGLTPELQLPVMDEAAFSYVLAPSRVALGFELGLSRNF